MKNRKRSNASPRPIFIPSSLSSLFVLGSLLTGHLFFLRFAESSRKREPNAAGPIIMLHEVATLVHLIESSKPEARAEGIRLIVLLEVP